MTIQTIDIARIDTTGRLRLINPNWVEAFAQEIAEGATPAPIEVVEASGDRWRLIIGGHRLAALAKLGRTAVDAIVWPARSFPDEGAMRLKEVQENILRFEPTEMDRAVAILTWKQIFEDTKPQPKRGRPALEKIDADSARIFAERFSTAAARALGISERSVNVAVQIANGLTAETRARIAFAPIADAQSELLQLAHQNGDRQTQIIGLLLAEPPAASSVAEAIAVLDRTPAPTKLIGWQKVSDRFSRLNKLEQARFLDAHADAIDQWLASRKR